MHVASLFIMLFAVWVLLSGETGSVFLMVSGALCSLLVAFLAVRKGVVDAEGHPVQILGTALVYWPWLAWQIVLANIDVTWRVWHPRLPIAPRMLKLPYRTRNDLTTVIYANSITLTPGTVTVSIEKKHMLVHALTEKSARALLDGEMERRVCRMERLS
ncbi:MAG TPA: Na+/H+ antiporter subunit E [Acidiferrobacterales bacterium]